VSAPWHNKQTARFAASSLLGWFAAVRYLLFSPEVRTIRSRHFPLAIDVLGSPQGSLLMVRAGIPVRLGVRGYAGGHSACARWVEFSPAEHVARSSLRFAELLGATQLPEARPQLFLTPQELQGAEELWRNAGTDPGNARIVLSPGAGLAEKRWPLEEFQKLARKLGAKGHTICVVGGPGDKPLGSQICSAAPDVADWTGKTSLRETWAIIEKADLLICNSSMAMHAGAAFRTKTVALLAGSYQDADAHAKQWGYQNDFLVLGKSRTHPEVYTAEEVLAAINPWLAR
ncbi:MAG TPA: glycosyltransferase family 9 protein, partial [Verrucomicrobiae bacterium]|nr:glycosyltransferase family 9 protein [Verrucomicrobiae bacterium]